MHECATNLPIIAPINRTESHPGNFLKLEFKFVILIIPCSSGSRNVWLLGALKKNSSEELPGYLLKLELTLLKFEKKKKKKIPLTT